MVTTAGFVWRISVLLLASREPDSMKKAEELKGVVAPWDIQVFPKRKSDTQSSADVALRPVRIRVCPSAVQRIQRQPRWPRRPPAASPPGRRSRAVEIELQPVDILVGCIEEARFKTHPRRAWLAACSIRFLSCALMVSAACCFLVSKAGRRKGRAAILTVPNSTKRQ